MADSHRKHNNISLVELQLPEKYIENFDVSSESSSSGVTELHKHIAVQEASFKGHILLIFLFHVLSIKNIFKMGVC
jgi:hypothetical protein